MSPGLVKRLLPRGVVINIARVVIAASVVASFGVFVAQSSQAQSQPWRVVSSASSIPANTGGSTTTPPAPKDPPFRDNIQMGVPALTANIMRRAGITDFGQQAANTISKVSSALPAGPSRDFATLAGERFKGLGADPVSSRTAPTAELLGLYGRVARAPNPGGAALDVIIDGKNCSMIGDMIMLSTACEIDPLYPKLVDYVNGTLTIAQNGKLDGSLPALGCLPQGASANEISLFTLNLVAIRCQMQKANPNALWTADLRGLKSKLTIEHRRIMEQLLPPECGGIANCENRCGDGQCAKVACSATGCPCSETSATCPQDCK